MAAVTVNVAAGINLKGLDKIIFTLLDVSRKLPQRLAVIMKEESDKIFVPAIKAQIEANNSIFTNKLYKSITTRYSVSGDTAIIGIGSFSVDYAYNVEKGAPPHQADLNKLIEYARKKKQPHLNPVIFKKQVIYRKKTKKERQVFKSVGISNRRLDAYTVAIRIFISIAKKGTKPHPYLVRTVETNFSAFERAIELRFLDLFTNVR